MDASSQTDGCPPRKSGIRILWESPGSGAVLQPGDCVRIRCSTSLNRGEVLQAAEIFVTRIDDRNVIAGLRYGLMGMRVGGSRKFRASPHLCYGSSGAAKVPPQAVLIFDVEVLALVSRVTPMARRPGGPESSESADCS